MAHIARLERKRPARFLVPLAGKTVDLRWLAERGHDVVGVEFVPEAISAFFEEQGLEPAESRLGGMPAWSAGGVTLVCGDIFEVTPEKLGRFDVLYDRAALVALAPETRTRYAELARAMLAEDGVIFLIALAYEQAKAAGPPWSIDEATVRELYDGARITVLAERTLPTSARRAQAGVATLVESAYLVTATDAPP